MKPTSDGVAKVRHLRRLSAAQKKLQARRKRHKKLNAANEYRGWAHFIPLRPLF